MNNIIYSYQFVSCHPLLFIFNIFNLFIIYFIYLFLI